MAFSNAWSNIIPDGASVTADLIDNHIRQVRLDVAERMNQILGTGTKWNSDDPIVDGTVVKSLQSIVTAIDTKPTINTTNNTIPKRQSASALTDSLITDNGTIVTVNGTFAVTGATLAVRGVTYTWPSADGTSNQVLRTDGAGTVSWVSLGSISGVTGTGTTNKLPKWTSSSTIGNSIITDDSGHVIITGTLGISGSVLHIRGVDYTWPTTSGSPGYVLQSDGAGTLSWVSFASVGGITGSGTTGTIGKWTASDSMGNSVMTESAGVITVSGNLQAGVITATSQFAGAAVGVSGDVAGATVTSSRFIGNAGAYITLPHTTEPTVVNGNIWTQTTGVFARISGATVGPMLTGAGTNGAIPKYTSAGVLADGPITVSGSVITVDGAATLTHAQGSYTLTGPYNNALAYVSTGSPASETAPDGTLWLKY
jgi:hypothetical protein